MVNRFKKSKYIRIVRLTNVDLDYLKKTKGRKSIAGRLEEIIKKEQIKKIKIII